MGIIDNYFNEKTDNLTFIELKENSFVELKGYTIKDHLPLPILTTGLIKGIKDGIYQEEIKVRDFIEGIIYTMGTDSKFPYIDDYKEILYAYDENIKDYIFCGGVKDLEEGNFDEGCIKLRALLVIDPEDINAIFNYGLGIEGLAKKFLENEDKKSEEFLNFATNLFESILEIDKDFSLAHYKLGYHYLYFEQYLKASMTWKKFIVMSKDEVLVQEIRNEIDKIDDDVTFETGLTYLIYNDFEKALSFFKELIPKYKDNWNLNFSIGKCYIGLEEFDLAIEYISEAIKLNESEPDLYNELGIIYYNKGDIIKAIDIFTNGINSCPKDLKLFYNRGMTYTILEEYDNALEDINAAYELEASEEIQAQKEELERIVNLRYNH